MTPLDGAISSVLIEVKRAEAKFPGFNSAHEGHSIIREEVEELWDHVKADTGYSDEAYTEALQIAAMCVRYMLMVQSRWPGEMSDPRTGDEPQN